tara:strand:- start:890 stop:997 length:108 start_codon:yes stop_codon:yes gene_type:complete
MVGLYGLLLKSIEINSNKKRPEKGLLLKDLFTTML